MEPSSAAPAAGPAAKYELPKKLFPDLVKPAPGPDPLQQLFGKVGKFEAPPLPQLDVNPLKNFTAGLQNLFNKLP